MNFSEKLHNFLGNARTKGGGVLHKDEWLKITQTLFDKESGKRKIGVKSATTTDEEWICSLEAEPALAGVAIRRELAAGQFWCKNNARKCTRRFFLNWLGKAERVVTHAGGEKSVVKQDIYVEPAGWQTSKRAQGQLGVSDESWVRVMDKGWFNLAPDMRKDILRAL